MIYSRNWRQLPRLAFIGALAFVAVAAQADLKIVAKTTVSTKRGPQVVTVITFFKGSKIRIDDQDVTEISDSKTSKTIYINHTRKAYLVANKSDATSTAAASVKNQHLKITAHISPTGKRKTIVGHAASEYVGDLTVSGDYPKVPGAKANAKIHLDEWTISAPGIAVSQGDMLGTVGTLLHSLAGVGGMKQVTQELAKVKGIPLNIDVELNLTITTAGGGAPQIQQHSYVTEAQFVTAGSLPESIFQVPSGYTQLGGATKKK